MSNTVKQFLRSSLLGLLLCQPLVGHADNYYSFDGTNDTMIGTMTTDIADPATIFFWARMATHPIAVRDVVALGNSAASNNDSYKCRISNVDGEYGAVSIDSAGTTTGAFATKTGQNGNWVPVICEFINDANSRAIFVSDQTGTNSQTRTVAATLNDIRFGESFTGAADWTGDLAYVSIWKVRISGASETSLLAGGCPSSIEASNLSGFWALQTNNATQPNDGTDATGDLTVTGATFNSGGGPNICGVAPSFSVAPSCSAAANGQSCTYTASATSTLYGVGVAMAASAPSCTQIKAGQNSGGTAALAAGSDANTGTSDTITVTGTNPVPKMDYYFCLNNANGDSAVDSSQADKVRTARSGFALVTIASVSTTGICDQDSYFNPDCSISDLFEYEDDINENANCNVIIGTDGDFTLSPVAGGDCDGRLSFEISYELHTSSTTGLFTAPASVGTFAVDDTIYINNTTPSCNPDPEDSIVLLTEDIAMTARDLTVLGNCTDADADVLSYSVTVGTLPVGTALSGTGNKDWTGTPNTENEAGVALTISATDIATASTTFAFTSYVVNTWTASNCVTNTFAECSGEIIAAAPWRAFTPGLTVIGTTCSSQTPGTIVSQTPTAGSQTAAETEFQVVTATNCGGTATERKIVFVLASLVGLTRWVDYIPVSAVPGCQAGTYEANGCWAVLALSSTAGKVAWVDYIPVGDVTPVAAGKWRYENNGWIPVDTLTP